MLALASNLRWRHFRAGLFALALAGLVGLLAWDLVGAACGDSYVAAAGRVQFGCNGRALLLICAVIFAAVTIPVLAAIELARWLLRRF